MSFLRDNIRATAYRARPAAPKTATCKRCNQSKPVDFFPLVSSGIAIRHSWCCECVADLETQTCKRCIESKPIESFEARPGDGLPYVWCRECRSTLVGASPASSSPEDAPDPETKTCQWCLKPKPVASFETKPDSKYHYPGWCRECRGLPAPSSPDDGLPYSWCRECRSTLVGAAPVDAFNAPEYGMYVPSSVGAPHAAPASSSPGVDSSQEYEPLRAVLDDAFQRATRHKGAERHGEEGVDFLDQIGPMIARNKLRWTLGQIAKKAFECERVTPDHAQKELHDIIIIATIEILNLDQL